MPGVYHKKNANRADSQNYNKKLRHGGIDETGWSCEPCEGDGREGRGLAG